MVMVIVMAMLMLMMMMMMVIQMLVPLMMMVVMRMAVTVAQTAMPEPKNNTDPSRRERTRHNCVGSLLCVGLEWWLLREQCSWK